MLVVNAKKEDLEKSRVVASVANVAGINLVECKIGTHNVGEVPTDDEGKDVTVDYGCEGFSLAENICSVFVFLRIKIDDTSNDSEEAVNLYEAYFKYAVEYILPEDPIPDDIRDECLPKFAEINGIYTAWPYMRSLFSTLSAAMGSHAITLPTLKVAVAQEDEA